MPRSAYELAVERATAEQYPERPETDAQRILREAPESVEVPAVASACVSSVQTEKRGKYGNTRTEHDGYTFDSALECERYKFLKLLEKSGEIHYLKPQSELEFMVKEDVVFLYKADFSYWENDQWIVEDVKPTGILDPKQRSKILTSTFMLKKRLVEADRGIRIRLMTKDKSGCWTECVIRRQGKR